MGENDAANERHALAAAIGEHIRVARIAKRLSQAQAAVRTSLTTSTYRSYELGDVLPPLDKLFAIAEFYGRPITFFLGLPDVPPMSAEDRLILTAFQGTEDPELRDADLRIVERNFREDQRARR